MSQDWISQYFLSSLPRSFISWQNTLPCEPVHYNRTIIIHALQGRNTSSITFLGTWTDSWNTEAKCPPDWSTYEFQHNSKCFL